MRKITVEIDCTSKTCGECRFVNGTTPGHIPFCDCMYAQDNKAILLPRKNDGLLLRLPECLAAEVKE